MFRQPLDRLLPRADALGREHRAIQPIAQAPRADERRRAVQQAEQADRAGEEVQIVALLVRQLPAFAVVQHRRQPRRRVRGVAGLLPAAHQHHVAAATRQAFVDHHQQAVAELARRPGGLVPANRHDEGDHGGRAEQGRNPGLASERHPQPQAAEEEKQPRPGPAILERRGAGLVGLRGVAVRAQPLPVSRSPRHRAGAGVAVPAVLTVRPVRAVTVVRRAVHHVAGILVQHPPICSPSRAAGARNDPRAQASDTAADAIRSGLGRSPAFLAGADGTIRPQCRA
jgi:hypothetical protein